MLLEYYGVKSKMTFLQRHTANNSTEPTTAAQQTITTDPTDFASLLQLATTAVPTTRPFRHLSQR